MKYAIYMIYALVLSGVAFPATAEEDLCAFLTQHKAAADVAYTPGVDVHGESRIIPADIGAPTIVPPEIAFDLEIDALQQAGIETTGVDPDTLESFINLGRIRVVDNQLYLNDELLAPEYESALIAECHKKK